MAQYKVDCTLYEYNGEIGCIGTKKEKVRAMTEQALRETQHGDDFVSLLLRRLTEEENRLEDVTNRKIILNNWAKVISRSREGKVCVSVTKRLVEICCVNRWKMVLKAVDPQPLSLKTVSMLAVAKQLDWSNNVWKLEIPMTLKEDLAESLVNSSRLHSCISEEMKVRNSPPPRMVSENKMSSIAEPMVSALSGVSIKRKYSPSESVPSTSTRGSKSIKCSFAKNTVPSSKRNKITPATPSSPPIRGLTRKKSFPASTPTPKSKKCASYNNIESTSESVSKNKLRLGNQKFISEKVSKRKKSILSKAVATRSSRVLKTKKCRGPSARASVPTRVSNRKKCSRSTAVSTAPARVSKEMKSTRPKALGSTSAKNLRSISPRLFESKPERVR